MWQCTDSGKVAGIGNGKTDVDLNFFMGEPSGEASCSMILPQVSGMYIKMER